MEGGSHAAQGKQSEEDGLTYSPSFNPIRSIRNRPLRRRKRETRGGRKLNRRRAQNVN